jgi:hypothetical protein
VVEAELPFASREHGEHLAGFGLPTKHISDRLRARLPSRQAGPAIHFSKHPPIVSTQVL